MSSPVHTVIRRGFTTSLQVLFVFELDRTVEALAPRGFCSLGHKDQQLARDHPGFQRQP
jgi:hypothetical protein